LFGAGGEASNAKAICNLHSPRTRRTLAPRLRRSREAGFNLTEIADRLPSIGSTGQREE
jgi:hypothetical protein